MQKKVNENSIKEEFANARRNPGQVVIEGFHAVKHAIRFGAEITLLASASPERVCKLADELAPDLRERLPGDICPVEEELFRSLTPRPVDTGLVGIARRPEFDGAEILSSPRETPVILIERAAHLGNLGAIVRTSAAAGARAVVTLDDVDPWHPAALRGSAGLHFALPVGRIDQTVLHAPTARPLWAIDPDGAAIGGRTIPDNVILAFGSERHGLSERLLGHADERVSLPMRTGVSSLNLAASVAALLYCWRLGAC